MSSDHDHDNGSHDHGHDGPPPATDIIPESSPQDLLLKVLTVVAAFLISGNFAWWMTQPLPSGGEHGGAEHGTETTEH